MGWDIERFPEGEVNLELICCICTGILEDPVESPCRHVFCSACIKTWLSNQKSCPHCRAPVYRKDLQSVVPLLKNIISKQKIHCDNRENGCEEIVTIESLPTHVATCQYGIISCANEGCVVKICRKDLKSHFEVCSKRTILCERGCEMLLTVGERTTHNCVQALRCHFQETTNEMQRRISKLEELVNVLVSKTITNRHDACRVIETSESYGSVPYSIPSPRTYDNAPPPFTVFSNLPTMNTSGNLNVMSAETNEFSDSVESVESDNTNTGNELVSSYNAAILRNYNATSRALNISSQEREITPPVYRDLNRISDSNIPRGRNERIRENPRNQDRSRSAHDRRQQESTYIRNRGSNNHSRETHIDQFYGEPRRVSQTGAEETEEPLILRIGVSSQTITDTSSSSGSSSDSDNEE